MASSRAVQACELWSVPGAVMAALSTPEGSALVTRFGPGHAENALVLAGTSPELTRGLARHAARAGMAAWVLAGPPGPRGAALLRAAAGLARERGAERVAFAVHAAWTSPALDAAPRLAELLAVLDPAALDDAQAPQQLRGIPLWIASGTEAASHARALHAAARHPRALVELAGVSNLERAVNDVAGALVPHLRDVFGR